MAVSMDEVNFLVWKYLQENGFPHSAFVFETESFADSVQLAGSEIPPNALLTLLQRSLLELKLEQQVLQAERDPDFQAAKELSKIKNTFPQAPRPPPIIPSPCSSISSGCLPSRPPLYISQAIATLFSLNSNACDIKWSPVSGAVEKKLFVISSAGTSCFYTSSASIPISGHYSLGSWFCDGSSVVFAGLEASAIVSADGKLLQALPAPLIAIAAAPTASFFVAIAPDGTASLHSRTGAVLKRFSPFSSLSVIKWRDGTLFAIGGPDGVAMCSTGGETTILNGAGPVKQFAFSNATHSALLALLTDNGIEIWRGNQRAKLLNITEPEKATAIAWQHAPPDTPPILLVGISSTSEIGKNFGNALIGVTLEKDPVEICKLAGKPTTIATTPGKIAVGMESGELLIMGPNDSVSFSRGSSITHIAWSGKSIAVSFNEPLVAVMSTEPYFD